MTVTISPPPAEPSILDTIATVNASLGFVRPVITEPAGFDCAIHNVGLLELHLLTSSGWLGQLTCPAHVPGSCAYAPGDGIYPVDAYEPPEADKPGDDAKIAAEPEVADKPAP